MQDDTWISACTQGVRVLTGNSMPLLMCAGCPPGFGANPDRIASQDTCVPCKPGSYYPGGKVEPCWRCRGSAYLTSPEGASSIVQCVCRPGERGCFGCCQPCLQDAPAACCCPLVRASVQDDPALSDNSRHTYYLHAGYGASTTAPQSCQVCPKGTFSNSLIDVVPQPPLDSLARFPPGVGNGKGKGGCYTCNPSYKECTSCCEASVRKCQLTTLTPGATSFADCKPIPQATRAANVTQPKTLAAADAPGASQQLQ